MDHEELIKRFRTDPDSLSQEDRAWTEAAHEHTQRKIEHGEFSSPRETGDDFAIGLDADYKPFPVRNRDDEQPEAPGSCQSDETDQSENSEQDRDA